VLNVEVANVALPLFVVAVVTAVMTSFYSFRMIGMIFFGEKSHHLEKMEEDGHHVHEAPAVMWLPYSILAVATLIIGLTGPFFEGFLENSLGKYLEGSFGMHIVKEGFKLNPIAVSGSLFALAIGGFLGYNFYIARRSDPYRIVQSNPLVGSIYKFLENRWYINALYYKIFVNGTMALGNAVFKGVELGILDKTNTGVSKLTIGFSSASSWFDSHVVDGIANGIATASEMVSGGVRKVQTGIVENQNEELAASWSVGSTNITRYSANKIIIDTINEGTGFLILTDTFYPTWRVSIDGKSAKLYIVDYNFRGAVVPSGEHSVEFYNTLF